ncbi:hypothetical protein [Methylomonas sp. AM2-LC]|uniref:hypothetical protein n=1 Tax=Methylomonas sp. AM2-LC TaxID=3153301 RepID=UPI003267FB58
MKIKYLLLVFLVGNANPVMCDDYTTTQYLTDIFIYRPGGTLLTLLGTSAFIATSPGALLVTLLPPHNAILETADNMIVEPFKDTFYRPVGSAYPLM